jgi:hypothetical protein
MSRAHTFGKYPIIFNGDLAAEIGLNQAIVLQKLIFLLSNDENGKEHDEHKWIYNTYEEWRDKYFPFWSVDTIQRIFLELEKRGEIISIQPEGKVSRRKYYRIADDRNLPSSDDRNLPSSYSTENTTESTSENTTPYPLEGGKKPQTLCELFANEEIQSPECPGTPENIMSEWNKHPELPTVRNLSESRKRKMKTRLKERFFLDNYGKAIDRIAKSDFLTGKNDRGWMADIEWFLRSGTIEKVMEGKYDNRGARKEKEPEGPLEDGFGVDSEGPYWVRLGIKYREDPGYNNEQEETK